MTNTHTTPTEVAAAIKGRLREAGISQTEVSLTLGIDRSSLNRRLNGKAPITSADMLNLSHLLGISVNDLVTTGSDAA